MGETDVTFRHLLRGLPRPILRLAFPDHPLEPLGPFDPSVESASTASLTWRASKPGSRSR
jgi:hypothetical protein